jgi:hypothetical protein
VIVAVPTVIYDANVLYPAPLRDLLIRVAMAGLVRPLDRRDPRGMDPKPAAESA